MAGNSRRTPCQQTGDAGETAALGYLLRQGYETVARNYHSRYGEIDLIVKNDEYLVFVEVKTRNEYAVTRPAAFVDKRKQQRIIKTAAVYLAESPLDLQPRFDVIEVTTTSRGTYEIDHLENAFWQEGDYAAY